MNSSLRASQQVLHGNVFSVQNKCFMHEMLGLALNSEMQNIKPHPHSLSVTDVAFILNPHPCWFYLQID